MYAAVLQMQTTKYFTDSQYNYVVRLFTIK